MAQARLEQGGELTRPCWNCGNDDLSHREIRAVSVETGLVAWSGCTRCLDRALARLDVLAELMRLAHKSKK